MSSRVKMNVSANHSGDVFFLRTYLENCSFCGKVLRVAYNTPLRNVITLSGKLRLRQTVYHCPDQHCTGNSGGKIRYYQSEEFLMASLPGCTVGLDVTLYIGYCMDIQKKTLGETHKKLEKIGVMINESTIYRQFQKYRNLLVGISIKEQEELKARFRARRGYVLAVDTVTVNGSPPLLVCLELTTGRVLHAAVISNEIQKEISREFNVLKNQFGSPVAVVSDMSPGFLLAIDECFPRAKHQFCHYHFLRSVGKGLMGVDYEKLRQITRYSKKKSAH